MQSNKDIGKIASTSPLAVAKATEHLIEDLVKSCEKLIEENGLCTKISGSIM